MRALIPEVAFISACIKNHSESDNLTYTKKLRDQLEALGLKFRACNGVYKGTKEYSFMVWLDHSKGITQYIIADIATEFNQKCILYRDNNKNAYLLGKNGYDDYEQKALGKLTEITPEQATELDSYTHFPLTDTYLGVLND